MYWFVWTAGAARNPDGTNREAEECRGELHMANLSQQSAALAGLAALWAGCLTLEKARQTPAVRLVRVGAGPKATRVA